MYDYLIVGAGLFGSVCAHELTAKGKSCLVVEKRPYAGGNLYCEEIGGIVVHKYGAHIFHTANETVWEYIRQFTAFNHYINSPLANYRGTLYNLPFNMNTFNKLWGVITPAEAKEEIDRQRAPYLAAKPRNLEEQALALAGTDIYEKLIRGYTEKQWGRPCNELPAFIIRRLPVRFTFDNNYFSAPYQGIPVGGYNEIFAHLLADCDVELGADYLKNRDFFNSSAQKIIFTGQIDAYYDYFLGALAWRNLRFETQRLDIENFQGNAVVNYTDTAPPYTRIIEHKHFAFGTQSNTVITYEYPCAWEQGEEAYYPVNDEKNQELYKAYQALAAKERNTVFGGRLGTYRYLDMDQVIESALRCVKDMV